MKENNGTLAFLFVAFMFFGIGFSVAKNIYTKENDMIKIPKLKTGMANESLFNHEDSTYRVITYVDSAIAIGKEFDDY